MMRYRRRGFSLPEVMGLLPIMAAMLLIGYQLVGQALRVQVCEGRLLSDDSTISDLVRRIQLDAGRARSAEVREEGGVVVLELAGGGKTVVYETSGRRVRRLERAGDGVETRHERMLEYGSVDFALERTGGEGGVVWISFGTVAPRDRGPTLAYRLSAAAAIGRGGGS